VQNQFIVKSEKSPGISSSSEPFSSIVYRGNSIAAMNDVRKIHDRWHKVLQEGLVPSSVRALGLLERRGTLHESQSSDKESKTNEDSNVPTDEEEKFFATLEGMEEEIQVMAILARAASLSNDDSSCAATLENASSDTGGMEQINAVMKCTAMLLFHTVLMASSPASSQPSSADGQDTTLKSASAKGSDIPGYDGRVRHVMKMACVDELTRAILESVERFDEKSCAEGLSSDEPHESPSRKERSRGLYDLDEYSLWNIHRIKEFLEQDKLEKDAVFGTLWKPPNGHGIGIVGDKKFALKGASDVTLEKHVVIADKDEKQIKLADESHGDQSDSNNGENSHQSTEEIMNDLDLSDSPSATGNEAEDAIYSVTKKEDDDRSLLKEDEPGESVNKSSKRRGDLPLEENSNAARTDTVSEKTSDVDHTQHETIPNDVLADSAAVSASVVGNAMQSDSLLSAQDPHSTGELSGVIVSDEDPAHAKRRFNAKFLATRKFELIERLIAIDIVRFLMAQEREQKLKEKEKKEQKGPLQKMTSMLRRDTEEPNCGNTGKDNEMDKNGDQEHGEVSSSTSNAEILNADRIKQIKRGLKIAGVSVTLGTIFAITGGLAAPALAAGIGGLAALTGAGTASSAAFLTVLATFKAGAALFGVGGAGISAYKMKKRTAGLTQFEVRRENIEQYMYPGASEEKMKRGIEAMLPHLHTTLCVSGWLRDNDPDDFQLAWGIQPTCRDEKDKTDAYRFLQLRRFYSIHNPPLVHLCEEYLRQLKKVQGKSFSWARIFNQLERKYGSTPDHMLPIDKAYDHELVLSHEEKEMIDGVLNQAKVVIAKQTEFVNDEMDFNETDEIAELLSKVSPVKKPRKSLPGDDGDDITTDINVDKAQAVLEEELNQAISIENLPGLAEEEYDHANALEGVGSGPVDRTKADAETNSLGGYSTVTETAAVYDSGEAKTVKKIICNENNSAAARRGSKFSGNKEDEEKDISAPDNNNHKQESSLISDDDDEDERRPVVWDWKRLYGSDIHTVTWESKMLKSLCHIVENVTMEVSSQATKFALQYSVIGAIISAVALPSALLTASKLIDDPYQIAVIRADEAGKELAKCLLQSDERRPVTLVGFSFGARVIFSCLRELARQQEIWERVHEKNVDSSEGHGTGRARSSFKSSSSSEEIHFEYEREPASLVADVVFIGLPRAIDKAALTACRRVAGGRFVNCYLRNDWLLSLMFLARGGAQACGTKQIDGVPGLENYDVTNLVESHTKYGDAIPRILQTIRFCEP